MWDCHLSPVLTRGELLSTDRELPEGRDSNAPLCSHNRTWPQQCLEDTNEQKIRQRPHLPGPFLWLSKAFGGSLALNLKCICLGTISFLHGEALKLRGLTSRTSRLDCLSLKPEHPLISLEEATQPWASVSSSVKVGQLIQQHRKSSSQCLAHNKPR